MTYIFFINSSIKSLKKVFCYYFIIYYIIISFIIIILNILDKTFYNIKF